MTSSESLASPPSAPTEVPEAISSLTSLERLDSSFTPVQQIVPSDCARGKELQFPHVLTNTSGPAQPLGA